MQAGWDAEAPSVLLIQNNLDPQPMFRINCHDFAAAMHGGMSVALRHERIESSDHRRNEKPKPDHNSSLSADCHLPKLISGPAAEMDQNIYARHSSRTVGVPECFGPVCVEVVPSDA
jgi:hypothetical protein